MLAGRVRVNGQVIRTLGTRVDPRRDRVEVDGRPVRVGPDRWILLNKPAGTLTTRRDPGRRPTVYGHLAPADRALAYVGRLDQDTEGLLLFTNDGDTAHALQHPSGGIEREYLAEVVGVPDAAAVRRLEGGVLLEDGPARAVEAGVTALGPRSARVRLVLVEGRKREVRRMLEAVGHRVLRLQRVRFGPIRIGGLAPGEWRVLTEAEVEALQAAVAGDAATRDGSREGDARWS